jgi:hypothetical protein
MNEGIFSDCSNYNGSEAILSSDEVDEISAASPKAYGTASTIYDIGSVLMEK